MPSKRESSARVDYVPALCTHRPSLLPIEWSDEHCEARPKDGPPSVGSYEALQILSFRGRRSRNKVPVGEPAGGSVLSNRPTPRGASALRRCEP